MLKRELIRIFTCTAIGAAIGTVQYLHSGKTLWLLLPVYMIGLLYAGLYIAKMAAGAFRSYFHGQLACLWSHPILGTIICILILLLSLAAILCIGWLVGVIRCVISLYTAVQEDRKINGFGCDAFF